MSVFSVKANPYINLHVYNVEKHFVDTIVYGLLDSPFGQCFIASTTYGICYLTFSESPDIVTYIEELKKQWPKAVLHEDIKAIIHLAKKVFNRRSHNKPIEVIVTGTEFQLQVWQALLQIPDGCLCAYSDIAEHIGRANANRAVGTAIGKNPVAYLIPCHRVIQKNGGLGGFSCGVTFKKRILAYERQLISS